MEGRSAFLDLDLISALACAVLFGVGLVAKNLGGGDSVELAFLVGACVAGGWRVAIRSGAQLLEGRLDVDLLMLVAAVGAGVIGRVEESAILLFLFSLGHGLEALATDRARNAIRALGQLTPKTARVVRDGVEQELPIEALAVGDLVRVKPGERIPVDGKVREGSSSVDQSPITGESVPVRKGVGTGVFAGTVNGEGLIVVATTKLATESTMARMVRLVEESQANRGRTQRMTERFTRIYTPIVLVSVPALIALLVYGFAMPFNDAFLRAMAVLVGASPCALVISTPSAVLAGIAQAARNGVLIKGGAYLEALGTIKAIAFDKTGTLTEGRPEVTDVVGANGSSATEVLAIAHALDRDSSHPIAQAIVRKAQAEGAAERSAQDVRANPGRGVEGSLDGLRAAIGSPRAFGRNGFPAIPADLAQRVAEIESLSRTVSVVALDGRVVGFIAVSDRPREGVAAILDKLRRLSIGHLVMLTGDNEMVAKTVAASLRVDEVSAGLLPERKIEEVRALMAKYGSVAMVGDGVNDAPALAASTVGIAMGASGTDVALEAADIALMGDDLSRLPFAVGLSRAARRIIVQNVVISLGVVAMLVPFAAFGVVPLGLAVVMHEGSTVVVAFNALRLLAYKEPQ